MVGSINFVQLRQPHEMYARSVRQLQGQRRKEAQSQWKTHFGREHRRQRRHADRLFGIR